MDRARECQPCAPEGTRADRPSFADPNSRGTFPGGLAASLVFTLVGAKAAKICKPANRLRVVRSSQTRTRFAVDAVSRVGVGLSPIVATARYGFRRGSESSRTIRRWRSW
jgi:hypothetical protein